MFNLATKSQQEPRTVQVENCKMCIGPLLTDSAAFSITCVSQMEDSAQPRIPYRPKAALAEVGTGTTELSPHIKVREGAKLCLKDLLPFTILVLQKTCLTI